MHRNDYEHEDSNKFHITLTYSEYVKPSQVIHGAADNYVSSMSSFEAIKKNMHRAIKITFMPHWTLSLHLFQLDNSIELQMRMRVKCVKERERGGGE